MRRFGLLGLLLTFLVVGIAGFIGYQMGLSTTVTAGADTVVYAPWGFGWGFPFFGFLFLILFFVLIGGVIRRAAWGNWHGGHGARAWAATEGLRGADHGGRGWDGSSVPPFVEPMLQEWHRRAHGEPAAAPSVGDRGQRAATPSEGDRGEPPPPPTEVLPQR